MAVVRFGAFEIDESSGELRRQGRRLHIAAQPLKALTLLTSRAGEVVSREELRRHLWGPNTFVQFDRSLNFCIAEIRRVLNDDARSPRFIETVPKRGYRFIADVHIVAPSSSAASSRRDEEDEEREGHQVTGAREGTHRRQECQSHGSRKTEERGWRFMRWVAAALVPLLLAQQPFRPLAHTRATADPRSLAAFQQSEQSTQDYAGRRRSIAALRTATRLDPRFAEAYFALAHRYFDLAMRRELPVDAAIAEARAAAERAVALEDVAETRQLLGMIRLIADWDWQGAQRELARAVALEPRWDLGQAAYARMLSGAGDDAGAIAAIDRAETLSPNCDLILFDAGQIYARAGRYDEAIDKLERAIQFGPPRDMSQITWLQRIRTKQLMINLARRNFAAAHKDAAALVALSGASEEVQRRFEAQDADRAIAAFLRRSVAMTRDAEPGKRSSIVLMAALEAMRGNADEALSWLERAAQQHDPELVYALRDPEFSALRPLPRYQALDARVRATHVARGHSS